MSMLWMWIWLLRVVIPATIALVVVRGLGLLREHALTCCRFLSSLDCENFGNQSDLSASSSRTTADRHRPSRQRRGRHAGAVPDFVELVSDLRLAELLEAARLHRDVVGDMGRAVRAAGEVGVLAYGRSSWEISGARSGGEGGSACGGCDPGRRRIPRES